MTCSCPPPPATRCLGELLLRAPHFNFRSNIVKLICQRSGTPITAMREVCCSVLRRLFDGGDPQGDVILEAVQLISKLVKDEKLPLPADAVRSFTALKLEVHEDTHVTPAPKGKKAKKGDAVEEDPGEWEVGLCCCCCCSPQLLLPAPRPTRSRCPPQTPSFQRS